jgi:hypothetical protein
VPAQGGRLSMRNGLQKHDLEGAHGQGDRAAHRLLADLELRWIGIPAIQVPVPPRSKSPGRIEFPPISSAENFRWCGDLASLGMATWFLGGLRERPGISSPGTALTNHVLDARARVVGM